MDNIDTKTGEVLAVRVSLGSLEAYLFLSTVRKKCINRDKDPGIILGRVECSNMTSKGLEKEIA